jgi:hypothetical protein
MSTHICKQKHATPCRSKKNQPMNERMHCRKHRVDAHINTVQWKMVRAIDCETEIGNELVEVQICRMSNKYFYFTKTQ